MGELKLRGRIWWIRYYRDGRRYEESARTDKKGKAQSLLKLREGAIARGEAITPVAARITVEQALTRVQQDYELKGQRSIGDLKRRIRKRLLPFFGAKRMALVTADDMAAYQAQRRAAGASPATVNREVAIVRRAFTLQRKAGTLFAVPHIERLREDNARQSFIEPGQLQAILEKLPAPLRPIVRFAYLTGWRVRSEVLPLEWRQVDRTSCTVRLEPGRTKNNKSRVFAYGEFPQLKELIDEQWVSHEALEARGIVCSYVFNRYDGRPVRDFLDAWRAACTAAGVSGKILHDLRRSAVRNLVRAGVPQNTAMSMTGHLTADVFRRYDIVSEADQRHAGAALGAFLRTESPGRAAGDGSSVGSGQRGS